MTQQTPVKTSQETLTTEHTLPDNKSLTTYMYLMTPYHTHELRPLLKSYLHLGRKETRIPRIALLINDQTTCRVGNVKSRWEVGIQLLSMKHVLRP